MPSTSLSETKQRPVALVTGSAARIGAGIARLLHGKGYNIVLHYLHSQEAALNLQQELNQDQENSCIAIQADLLDLKAIEKLAQQAAAHWGRLNVLINNASSFYPGPLQDFNDEDWFDLLGTNARAPAFLCKACYTALHDAGGCIINISDIAASSGRSDYSFYAMAKAALENLTRSLARELAPDVRVNAVAPGFILPPHITGSATTGKKIETDPLSYSCLNYPARIEDIANAVYFLITQGSYITGQTLSVDAGRKLKS